MPSVLQIIRKAIAESGQSRYRISQETGIAQSQLSRIMSGATTMTLETFERLAKHLGLEIVIRPAKQKPLSRKEK